MLDIRERFAKKDLAVSEMPTAGFRMPASVQIIKSAGAVALETTFGGKTPESFELSAVRGAMSAFIALEDGNDVKIQRFVIAHGPLSLNRDGTVRGFEAQSGSLIEPVDPGYRFYARVAAAAARSALAAVQFEAPDPGDEAVFLDFLRREFPEVRGKSDELRIPSISVLRREATRSVGLAVSLLAGDRKKEDQGELAAVIARTIVNWWLDVRDVRPLLWQNANAPARLQKRWSGGLWGAIGNQLLERVERDLGTPRCNNCGRAVTMRKRERRPKTGQRIWCGEKVCRRAKEREAKARSRARPAQAERAD